MSDDHKPANLPGAEQLVPIAARTADALARTHLELAMQTLAEVCEAGEKDADRVHAAKEILDRGFGKPLAATISIPMPKKLASQLYAMDDDELMEILVNPESRQLRPADPLLAAPAAKDDFDWEGAMRDSTDAIDLNDPLFE